MKLTMRARKWVIAHVLLILTVPAFIEVSAAAATTATLVNAIDLSASNTDIVSLGTDGTNLLVLHNVLTPGPDRLRVFDINGNLIKDFSAGSAFTNGLTFTGTRGVFARGTSASEKSIFDMDLSTGAISGPYSFVGFGGSLTFDGSSILRVDTGAIRRHAASAPYEITGTLTGTPPITLVDGLSGITWLDGSIFAIQNFTDPTIYQLDTNLNLLAEIDISFVPGGVSPRDITAVNGDLFVADRGKEAIYRFTIKSTGPVDLAKSLVGAPYLFGGKGWDCEANTLPESRIVAEEGYPYFNPSKGFSCDTRDPGVGVDCSGLIFWSYNKALGGTVPPTRSTPVYYPSADSQFRYNSQPVAEDDLKAGDLLFFNYSENGYDSKCLDPKNALLCATHVGMYTGGPGAYDIIEAYSPTEGVRLSKESALRQEVIPNGFRRITKPKVGLQARIFSPADLIVTDPDGFAITHQTAFSTDREILREIPGSLYYFERDANGDGQLEGLVVAPIVKPGNYIIKVAPKADALPSDTYTLEVEIDDKVVVLAADTPIEDIPTEGYGVRSSGTGVFRFVPINIDIEPHRRGNIIRVPKVCQADAEGGTLSVAVLSAPGFDARTVDEGTVVLGDARLSGTAVPVRSTVREVNRDGLDDLVFAFAVCELARAGALDQDTKSMVMTAETLHRVPVSGMDSVKVVHVGTP